MPPCFLWTRRISLAWLGMNLFDILLPWWTHIQAWQALNAIPTVVPSLRGQWLQPRAVSLNLPPTSLFCYCWPTLLISDTHFYSVAHLPSWFLTFPPLPVHAGSVPATCCHSVLIIQGLTYLDLIASYNVLFPSIALTLIASTNCNYFNSLKVMRPLVPQMLGIVQWSL